MNVSTPPTHSASAYKLICMSGRGYGFRRMIRMLTKREVTLWANNVDSVRKLSVSRWLMDRSRVVEIMLQGRVLESVWRIWAWQSIAVTFLTLSSLATALVTDENYLSG